MRTGGSGHAGGERAKGAVVRPSVLVILVLAAVIGAGQAPFAAQAATGPTSLRSDVLVRHLLDTGTSPPSVRLARDPRSDTLYYLKEDGSIFQVDLTTSSATRVFTSA